MVRRRKSPNLDLLASDLLTLSQSPPQKTKTPLELFVEQNFDQIVEAINLDHSLGAICALLAKRGLRSTTAGLKQTVHAYAVAHNRVSDLPLKLLPIPGKSNDVTQNHADSRNRQNEACPQPSPHRAC